jgi:cell division protein FtsA
MARSHELITAVEIGTGSIKVFMGDPLDDGSMAIAAFHEAPTLGKVVKGEVVNVAAIVEQLSYSLNTVEENAGARIGPVYVALSGDHIGSTNVQGSAPVRSPDRIIAEEDIVDATRHARNYSLPIDQMDIHSFQRTYLVDGHRRTSKPLGMAANKLTADIHVIYGNRNNTQTTLRLLDEVLGFSATDVAFSAIADIYGVGIGNEARNGMLLMDMGTGVTEYALFHDDGCMHSGQFTIGCDHIANDLAVGLRLPISKCREILKNHGTALRRSGGNTETITVETSIGHPAREIKLSTVETIIEVRLFELFELIKADLEKNKVLRLIGDGIVFCGGGALIPNITELMENVYNVPVMVGTPGNISGATSELNSPRYVTPIGLLQLGRQMQQMDEADGLPLGKLVKRDFVKFVDLCKRAIRL